jgi:hypothetical protein
MAAPKAVKAEKMAIQEDRKDDEEDEEEDEMEDDQGTDALANENGDSTRFDGMFLIF